MDSVEAHAPDRGRLFEILFIVALILLLITVSLLRRADSRVPTASQIQTRSKTEAGHLALSIGYCVRHLSDSSAYQAWPGDAITGRCAIRVLNAAQGDLPKAIHLIDTPPS